MPVSETVMRRERFAARCSVTAAVAMRRLRVVRMHFTVWPAAAVGRNVPARTRKMVFAARKTRVPIATTTVVLQEKFVWTRPEGSAARLDRGFAVTLVARWMLRALTIACAAIRAMSSATVAAVRRVTVLTTSAAPRPTIACVEASAAARYSHAVTTFVVAPMTFAWTTAHVAHGIKFVGTFVARPDRGVRTPRRRRALSAR
jgi:hypothetical protein